MYIYISIYMYIYIYIYVYIYIYIYVYIYLEYNTQVLAIEMTGRKPLCIKVQITAMTSTFYFMLVLCVSYSKTIKR